MNRSVKTAIQIGGIIGVIFVCAAIMYFGLADSLGKTYITGTKTKIIDWTSHYKNMLIIVMLISMFTSLLWYVLSRFVFKITSCFGVGKRAIWLVICVVNVIGVLLATALCSNDTTLKVGFSLYIIHVILFSVVGYYLTSVLFTPAAYKYTPVGANLIKLKK
ncbi:MAG: hypothetical protein PHQ44_00560 [Anaerovibrio sp.]|nr:hypothetical protein [Anaerovibrio sp.]